MIAFTARRRWVAHLVSTITILVGELVHSWFVFNYEEFLTLRRLDSKLRDVLEVLVMPTLLAVLNRLYDYICQLPSLSHSPPGRCKLSALGE